MTLATIKKLTAKLTPAQRVRLAEDLLEEVKPITHAALTLEELDRRSDEALSGKVKLVSATESKARIGRLMTKIRQDRQSRSNQ